MGLRPGAQFAIRSAVLLGAKQVIAIDNVPERLSMAAAGGAITINFDQESVLERLQELTGGKGPEKCIDAVGMEAHAARSLDSMVDRAKQAVMLGTDRPHALREMMYVCRPAGILSVPGVYGGFLDKVPFGAAMNKGLTIRMGQTHVNRWTDDLLRRIESKQIDPSFVITHQVDAAAGPGDVQDLQRQAGRLHQGDDQTQRQRETLTMERAHALQRNNRYPNTTAGTLALQLGWFSVALGAVELLAARRLTRALGMRGQERLVQAYGVREIVKGVGILTSTDPAPWLWGRVAGDALDLGTLAVAYRTSPKPTNVAIAMANVAMVAALDVMCAQQLSATRERQRLPMRDYGSRSGLPLGIEASRGAASDAPIPADMLTPELLRPFTQAVR